MTETRRAFVLRRGGELVGYLGEGPGPFLTATRSALPAPLLPTARFTSRAARFEAEVTAELRAAEAFDALIERLRQAGFELEPSPYAALFGPSPGGAD